MEQVSIFPESVSVEPYESDVWPFKVEFLTKLQSREQKSLRIYLDRTMVEELMAQLRHEWAEFASKGAS